MTGMLRSRRWAVVWTTLVASGWPVSGSAQGMPPELTQFLQHTIAVSSDELSNATGGRPLVKVLAPQDPSEIAVLGVVHISVPRAFYVHRAIDFLSSLRDPSRLRFALLSDPVTPSDMVGLSLPHDDVQDLAHCRAGACKVKLSAEAIGQLRTSIDLGSPSADSAASAFFRRRMMDYVTAYRARGNRALIVYADEDSVTAAERVFAGILSRSPYMYQYAPSLERYLENYPGDRPADVSEALFWSEDDLPGLKATITLTHVVVYDPPELPGSTLIASKLLYADHYLDGALDLTAVVDQAGNQEAGIYLVVLHRLHFDELPSGGLIDIRGKVIGKLRDRTTTWLRDTKTRSEQAFAGAPVPSR